MSSTKYSDLEQNVKFKSRFVPKNIWFKNFIYLLAPVILLVFSVFSILYIFEAGRITSLITLPYVLIFVVGIVFLRLSRIYILKKEVSRRGHYLVCLGKVVKEDNDEVYLAFSTAEKRQDKNFLERQIKQLNADALPVLDVKDEVYCLDASENGEKLNLKVLSKKKIYGKKNAKEGDDIFLLEYVDDSLVVPIATKSMKKLK